MTASAHLYDARLLAPVAEEETRARLDAIARLLDSALRLPGTNVRFGADAVLNLIPGLGTAVSKGLSAYLIWEARRLGVPLPTLLRMIGNVGVDFLIGVVPVVGWVGDVFFRSNQRNMAHLRRHLDERSATRRGPVIEGSAVRIGEGAR